jgi:gamma-butyrobetaine dioxygenase
MARTSESGRRHGEVRPEWKELLGEVGRVPVKLSAERSADARAILQRDGAVVVRDQGGDPERLVTAAAETLGGRLRELFGIRPQGGVDAPPLGLHSDGATVVVDVHGRSTRLRDPDEDFLLMLCSGRHPRAGTRSSCRRPCRAGCAQVPASAGCTS